MCRLFGMSAAPHRVRAIFWLLEAPDSLAEQSRREPDGVGLGVFEPDGSALVHKRPIAAYQDREFAQEARKLSSTTFIAHVRYASTGGLSDANTHPFLLDGRLFAHNGVVTGLDDLDKHLDELYGGDVPVRGETDSERVFALITAHARRHGDVSRAIVEAIGWISGNLPVYALNLVLTAPTGLWALRWPETHPLLVLPRAAGGPHGDRQLDHASGRGTVRVRSRDLAGRPAVVVATERMDDNPDWQELAAGELLHVAADGTLTRRVVVDGPPSFPLTLADLHPKAAASQS
jgi:glutamine amidotransferase